MSDMQDTIDILRPDKTSPSVVVSHSDDNKLQDLIEQDTSLYENHFKDVHLKEHGDETNKIVSKHESDVLLEQENGTNEELLINEIEIILQQEKPMNDSRKTNELVNPIEINSDAYIVEPSNETYEKVEEYRSSEENPNLSVKNETSGTTTDSWRTDDSSGSSNEEDVQVLEGTQFPYHADEKNLNGGSGLIMSSVDEIESKNEQIPVSVEHVVVKEDDKVCKVTDGPAEEQNLNYSTDSNITSVNNSETSTEYSIEDSTVSQATQVPAGPGEPNSNSGNDSKVSEVVNAGTSTEGYLEECNVSQSTQVPGGTDEGNSSSQINSNEVKNLEKSTEDSNEDASDEEISNYRESSPKEGRTTSEQVAEIISRRLNSEEYKKKLSEINDIVKRLTAVEFFSPQLSPEDVEALEELYFQQVLLEEDTDCEAYSEVSESNAMKRKSKETSGLDEEEDFLATSKKCKFSKDLMDSWLFSGETSCCLEEQFRLACELSKEDNEGEKEYKFPITESGENSERKYKLCKHQMAKIDAMVVSAMSMESYLSQLNDAIARNEMSTEDLSSEFSIGKSAFLDNLSNVSESSRTRKFNNKDVARRQKSFLNKELISQPKEQLAGVERNHIGYGYFGLGKAFNSIKNLILVVAFTGSLAIAITAAKICGVTFPVPKSQNLPNDSMSSLQEFPDINLDES